MGFDLLRLMLSLEPSEAQVRCAVHGFLPLHEAAWGGASAAVAVLLCAVYPGAVTMRNSQGETAHDMGEYYHGRRFRWPDADALLQCGAELRTRLLGEYPNLRHALAAKEDLHALAESLAQLQPRATRHVPAAPSAAALRRELASDQAEAFAVPLPGRAGGGRRLARPALAHDGEEHGGVNVVRDLVSRDSGRFAGLRRVRNRRCSFQERSTLVVGGVALHLRRHIVRTVGKDFQRPALEAKWPSKVPLRRERASERACKSLDC